ncbi:Fc.00g097880.m01.CDS01 [Cosmosporella sp. VM-42]
MAMGTSELSQLEIDLVPGTEIVRVTDESHHDVDIFRPRPTSDPHDPLNWTRPWKYLAAAVQALYCFIGVTSALSIGPMYPLLGAEFGLNGTQLNLLTGAAVLVLGYSNFIVVPVANVFGRRFVSIVLAALSLGTCIWEARSQSYNVLLAARIINGFSISTTETLMVQVVADMFFLHERGLWIGVYFTSFFSGLFIGPVISGNIAARHGWRSYFWLSTGLCALALVALALGFPETKWHREPRNSTEAAVSSSPAEAKETTLHNERDTFDNENVSNQLNKGRPSKAAFNIIMHPDPEWKKFIFKDAISCARIFSYPIVLWAGMCLAGPANLLLHWNITQSSVLSAPPHNFSVGAVGYSNFAFLIGGLFGLFTAGPISDWYARRATLRNGGIREPEFRLPVLIPYFVITVVGIVIGGCAEQYEWHWSLIVVVGYGFTGLCVTSVPTIAIAYSVDSYKAMAGEIMVVATVIKNTCGFGMTYWVPQLTERKGYLDPVMVQLALVAGPMLLAVPLYFWGKSLRWLTRNSRVHRMESEI